MNKLKTYNFEQRTPEWEAMRLGRTGGSEAIGLSTDARSKTLLITKLAEILTGSIPEQFTSEAMQDGIDNEPIAIAEYEAREFCAVNHVGYITNDDYQYLGLSPDGLVYCKLFGDDSTAIIGAVEVKCPQPKSHIKCILEDKVPAEYRNQVAQYFVILPDLEWVDFVTYNAAVTSKPYHKIRVTRQDYTKLIQDHLAGYNKYVAKLEDALTKFE